MKTGLPYRLAPRRRKFFPVAVLLVALAWAPLGYAQSLPRARPEAVGLSSERLKRLSDALGKYVRDGKLSGGVVLVARRGKVAHVEAFGQRDREARAPMREDAIFRIASQTKALVSVGVMMLLEEGRLVLTDPVGEYLPEFRETTVAVPKEGGGYEVVKAKRRITVRDLLTHTAGVGYGGGVARDRWEAAKITGWYFADRDEPVGATVARMAQLPFDAHPGERFVYGYSTDILGVLIERVSGQTLEEFLRARLLVPLGMKDTHFYLPESKAERFAVVYSAKESGGLERAPEPGGMVGQGAYLKGPRKSFSGGAGLVSTAEDYARFLQMLLNGGELDGKRILSRKSVELMTVDHLTGQTYRDGQGFGLGFNVVEDLGARGQPGSVGEFGWGGAYHSVYWVDPKEQLLVVYFTQLIPARGLDDHDKLRALVYQAIVD
ncbi:MAG TPA: serine hydrolase domain-containing protein [Pyrinomonadaceae bacterium]|nr:serine hydrolase domain-containing protein [Pyrinomonadaceae bacterium]